MLEISKKTLHRSAVFAHPVTAYGKKKILRKKKDRTWKFLKYYLNSQKKNPKTHCREAGLTKL